jgi:hypothetical protein
MMLFMLDLPLPDLPINSTYRSARISPISTFFFFIVAAVDMLVTPRRPQLGYVAWVRVRMLFRLRLTARKVWKFVCEDHLSFREKDERKVLDANVRQNTAAMSADSRETAPQGIQTQHLSKNICLCGTRTTDPRITTAADLRNQNIIKLDSRTSSEQHTCRPGSKSTGTYGR